MPECDMSGAGGGCERRLVLALERDVVKERNVDIVLANDANGFLGVHVIAKTVEIALDHPVLAPAVPQQQTNHD